MTTYTQRPFRDAGDAQRLLDLVYADPDGQGHVLDMPYRLSAWSLDTPDNTRLWEDASGRLAGFAIVQGPWGTLDFGASPAARATGLEAEIMAWGVARAQAIADRRRQPFTLALEARADDAGRRALFQAHGFTEHGWDWLHLVRDLDEPPEAPTVPDGFRLRPLRGEAEAGAYVDVHQAAFGTRNMTLEWRQRTLLLPQHRPDLDLVVEAPAGTLAAVCIGWLDPAGGRGQVEPLAVRPDYQRLGLGRALLLEMFRRMRAAGARRVSIAADAAGAAPRALYAAVGFRPQDTIEAYTRTFEPRGRRR